MVVGHIIVLDIQTVIGDCNGNIAHRKNPRDEQEISKISHNWVLTRFTVAWHPMPPRERRSCRTESADEETYAVGSILFP